MCSQSVGRTYEFGTIKYVVLFVERTQMTWVPFHSGFHLTHYSLATSHSIHISKSRHRNLFMCVSCEMTAPQIHCVDFYINFLSIHGCRGHYYTLIREGNFSRKRTLSFHGAQNVYYYRIDRRIMTMCDDERRWRTANDGMGALRDLHSNLFAYDGVARIAIAIADAIFHRLYVCLGWIWCGAWIALWKSHFTRIAFITNTILYLTLAVVDCSQCRACPRRNKRKFEM